MNNLPDESIKRAEEELLPAAIPSHAFRKSSKKKGFGRLIRILGPGVVTGAADDDPSGIATYSQAGAQFGFQTPWTLLLTFPLMVAVQEACMRIGAVTGRGLAAIVRDRYGKWLLYPMVLMVVIANTVNIGADIGAMAASLQLLLPGISFAILAVVTALLILFLEIFLSYRTYVRVLKWLALALFAYFGTAFLVHVPWTEALQTTILPSIHLNKDFIYMVVAIFGTTISPYLFFWQTSNVVEDEIAEKRLAQKGGTPRISKKYLRRLRLDTVIGMLFSNVTAWFIIVVAAVVLNSHGVSNIATAADAAKALEPLVKGFPNAGFLAEIIFTIGIVGIGLMSIPVLAGSSSYALSETFNWREGLFRKFKQAREFYLVIIVGTLLGLIMNFIGLDPIKALVFSAVLNGIVAVPLIYLILRVLKSETVMGQYKAGFWSQLGLWASFIVMLAAAIGLFASFIFV